MLTDNHDGKVKALLDGLAVDLVRQVGETNISLELLAKSAAQHGLLRIKKPFDRTKRTSVVNWTCSRGAQSVARKIDRCGLLLVRGSSC